MAFKWHQLVNYTQVGFNMFQQETTGLKLSTLVLWVLNWNQLADVPVRPIVFKGMVESCFQTANAFKVHGYCSYSYL